MPAPLIFRRYPPHERFVGTTCAGIGCMLSELLIAAGHAAQAVRSASVVGIEVLPHRIDGPAVLTRLCLERDAFVSGILESIDQIPDGIRQKARPRFIDATTLELDDGHRVNAKAIVIATGARPHVPTCSWPSATAG